MLKRLPSTHRVVFIKNEFGDVQVDSALAQLSNIASVKEFQNGCVCCVLVGQLREALIEVATTRQPDRIVVETSGSAFPAPIAWQVQELHKEGLYGLCLDAIVTVVDCENFCGYEDTSYTAKLQAQYTDIILLNKWELVNDQHLDRVIDHVYALNPDTLIIKCDGREAVDPELVFDLESHVIGTEPVLLSNDKHHMEKEFDTLTLDFHVPDPSRSKDDFVVALSLVSKDQFYRIKGFINFNDETFIINWAFGRYELVPTSRGPTNDITIMGPDLFTRGSRTALRPNISETLNKLFPNFTLHDGKHCE